MMQKGEVMEWINVKKHLPLNGQRVLVCGKEGGGWIEIAIWHEVPYSICGFSDKATDFTNWEFENPEIAWALLNKVRYWMPLPEPPKE